ncbi:MAG: DivIVA domain-containing protein [Firmicutes bacterium]|nr:DivIVA domain-containing protein [Bacillota bacterium]
MLRPIDIHQMDFKQVFRGYNKEQVDDFLSRLVSEYETLYQKNQELEEQIEELKSQVKRYTSMEDTLQETLAYVKDSSSEIKDNAELIAERIIDEAKLQADEILLDAKRRVADEIRQAEEALAFRGRVRRRLETQLTQLLEEVKLLYDYEDESAAASASRNNDTKTFEHSVSAPPPETSKQVDLEVQTDDD